jgi:pimeloyl-ACP methyl ester carboxylesterase/protein-tyrosine phosphatase
LLKKHSQFRSYTTSFATYPKIRIFFRPHAQADKLPNKPKPLPLLVFIHGLGGSIAQFNNILTSLVNVGPCLAVDLPGCGLSEFAPRSWDAYSHPALVELLSVVITDFCEQTQAQEVVLIGHSMGCSLAASLISESSSLATNVRDKAIGLVAVCPKVSRPSVQEVKTFGKLLSIPSPMFDLWRAWDRRGGVDSVSVERFVGPDAHPETKKLQVRFNEQSKTNVWRRMARGAVPSIDSKGELSGGLPGPEVWAGIPVPMCLVAGAGDRITKAEEVSLVAKALGKDGSSSPELRRQIPSSTVPPAAIDGLIPASDTSDAVRSTERKPSYGTSVTAVDTSSSDVSNDPTIGDPTKTRLAAFKTSVLPAPAGHALLYDHATYRTLCGLIQSFLADHIDSRLSLGWQLQHLKEANKWDVKNLAKWQSVNPVSEPIAGTFRAMKTLRQVDDTHSPPIFVSKWGDKIKAVIDISHETPVYDPRNLDDGGIQYNKFATVSKIPPNAEEVGEFIALVERIKAESKPGDERLIGVHCHYGFNRTGYFICCYLIEKEKYTVHGAIEEFQTKRPPGIRHEHFLDTLSMRYHTGLQRAPTL